MKRASLLHSAVLAALIAPVALHAQGTDIVRGRVTSDSGAPIPAASILVVQLSDQRFKPTQSDSAGRWQVSWPGGTGAYSVRITATGRRPFQTQVSRSGADPVLVVDARLASAAPVALAPITVRATAPRPDRAPPNGAETGAAETMAFVENAQRRLPPDLAGDLTSIVTLGNPAALPAPGGYSVLGLAPGQNSVVLNGMAFPGATLPRSTGAVVRASTTSYDPSNGWFSGSRTNVQLVTGGLFTSWSTRLSADAPALQAGDPVAAQFGQRFRSLDASLGGDGRLFDDRFAYNVALQGSHRSTDLASVVGADADVLQRDGIAVDSATRFRQLVQQAGVPLAAGRPASGSTADNVVFLGRVDHTPYDWNTMTAARSTWGLTGYGSWNRAQASGMGPAGTPAHAGTATRASGALQGEYSWYFGHDYLGDVRTGLTYQHNTSVPYLQLPDGRVRVVSELPDSTGGVNTLAFGGNAGLSGEQRAWTWESTAELQLFPAGAQAHRVKLNADLRLDGFRRDLGSNPFGTFGYNSLADLAANTPASFTRTVNAPIQSGRVWNAYASIGDLWRLRANLQVMYGLRVEGDLFMDRPAYNPVVDSLFGARTDYAPNTFALIPRLGFTWNRLGANGRPTGSLRGGIGAFRNLLDLTLLGTPSVSTGLAGGTTRLTCIGTAVPVPDWTAWAADPTTIPSQCAAGGPSFADAATPVQLIGQGYTAEQSWRANLAWSSSWHGQVYSIGAVWSENRDQHGTVDLNFAGTPQFTVPGENRPVFANAASIVPSSGVVSAVDARRTALFGRVVSQVADLRSTSRQVTLTWRPSIRLGNRIGDPSLAYTWSSSRTLARGFDAATFGSPAAAEWARSDLDARHQFQLQLVFRPLGDFRVLLFVYGSLRSGLPYTSLVAGDVNGDGLANDRAFIFDPAAVTDAALGQSLRTLLASPAPGVADCLGRQLGQAAARNSCQGPWTTALNVSMRLNGEALLHIPRLDLTINFANPLSGLDELLHGANGLHGWGGNAVPDPTLYSVRGFDPNTHQFLYTVNPRFGATLPASTVQRAPFRMTVTASIDLGRALPAQQLDRWLMPGRAGHSGSRVDATQLRRRLDRQVPDPYTELLGQSDSLLLSAEQVAALRQVDRRYQARMDSTWASLTTYLVGLPDTFDRGVAYHTMDAAIDDAWELTRLDIRRELGAVLTPEQLVTLGGWAGQLWRAPSRVHIRLFMAM